MNEREELWAFTHNKSGTNPALAIVNALKLFGKDILDAADKIAEAIRESAPNDESASKQ